MKEIILKDIFERVRKENPHSSNIIELAMKEACRECFQLAAGEAVTKKQFVSTGDYSGFDKCIVDKESILKLNERVK